MIRSTHTYAVLEIGDAAYSEISDRLRFAGYDHAFHEADGKQIIDMHGIAIARASVVPESAEHARMLYQSHMNACFVCRAPESSLCDEGKRLHSQWRGLRL